MIKPLLIATAIACSAAAASAQQPDTAARIARYEEIYGQTGNGSALWLIAEANAAAGHGEAAVEALRRIADLKLGLFPPSDSALARLAGTPAYDALIKRMAAELPQVRRTREAVVIAKPGLVSEGISADPRNGRLFVGDQHGKMIYQVSPVGLVRPFARQIDHRPLGIATDLRRQLLWVATSDAFTALAKPGTALLAFDLNSGRLKRTLRSAELKSLNDVAVAPNGDVYATDSLGGAVFRLAAGGSELKRITPAGEMSYPNGIALTPDGRYAFVAQGLALRRVSLPTGEVVRIGQPSQLVAMGIDGLYWHDGRLIAVQNVATPGRILRLSLNPPLDTVSGFEILEAGHPDFDIPTTAALIGNKGYFLANSQLTRLKDTGISEGPPLKPLKILEKAIPD
jgi:SMP-30/Gluconolactonase/LRE-like region